MDDLALQRGAAGDLLGRLPGRLLDAVLAVGAELELSAVLHRIVSAAADLVDARYGALAVLAPDGKGVDELVQVGLDERTIAAIGTLPTFCGVLGVVVEEPVRMPDITAHPRFTGFPRGHPRMRSFLGVPVRVRDAVFGNLYLTDKRTADEFTAEDESLARVLASAAGIAVQNARLYEQSRRRQVSLEAASRVTQLLLSGAAESEVFTAIAEHVRRLTGTPDAAVLLSSGGGRLRVIAGVGPMASAVIGFTVDENDSLSGRALRSGKALNLTEAEVDAGQRASPGLPKIGPSLLVPFGGAGDVRGVITASRQPGAPPFPTDDLPAVEAFAKQAELAYELARHRRDSELLSLFAERDRIARNLHDQVIQRLFATGMALEGAASLAEIDPANAVSKIRQVVLEIDATIKQLRTTVYALQDPAEATASLRAKVIDIVDSASVDLGFAPAVRFDGLINTAVDTAAAKQLLAVLREALSNVAKHAAATEVGISVSAGSQLRLTIADNGAGPDDDARRSGLANLAVRAEQLGGRLTVIATDPGTRLIWTVPLAT
jgi:signal transduction histidine kinase